MNKLALKGKRQLQIIFVIQLILPINKILKDISGMGRLDYITNTIGFFIIIGIFYLVFKKNNGAKNLIAFLAIIDGVSGITESIIIRDIVSIIVAIGYLACGIMLFNSKPIKAYMKNDE
ncbi:hypothetical protein [Clostridium sp. DL1XJH146]